MKVRLLFDFDDRTRKALAHHYGNVRRDGLATVVDFQASIQNLVEAWVDDLRAEYDRSLELAAEEDT